ncbi:HTH-type transcriptional regulator TdfR [Rhodococcus sp. Br-6]|nr:HTH-type transcriptional regulator TdfR [Rhodococcus sp. Br-6]
MGDIDRLRYVVAVARESGIGQAARTLGVSQPTVSRAVAETERRLGRSLFERLPAGVQLAAAAADVLARIERLIADHDTLFASDAADVDTVRVAYTWGGLTPGLEQLLEMWRHAEGAAVDLVQCDDPFAELEHSRADLALIRRPEGWEPPPHVRTAFVSTEPRVILINSRHPLATRSSVTLAEVCARGQAVISELGRTVPDDLWGHYQGEPIRARNPLTWINTIAAAPERFGVTSSTTAEFYIHPHATYVACSDAPPATVELLHLIPTRARVEGLLTFTRTAADRLG